MKVQKIISIDTNINDIIKQKKKNTGFNFSEWVESTFIIEFLDINNLEKQKKECIQKITDIEEQIINIQNRERAYSCGLREPEKRFLLSIPKYIKEGKNEIKLTDRFNKSFHKDWSVETVMKTIDYLKEEIRDEHGTRK